MVVTTGYHIKPDVQEIKVTGTIEEGYDAAGNKTYTLTSEGATLTITLSDGTTEQVHPPSGKKLVVGTVLTYDPKNRVVYVKEVKDDII